RALERAAGFARFVCRQAVGKYRVIKKEFLRVGIAPARFAVILAVVLRIAQPGKIVTDPIAAEVDTSMKPGLGLDRGTKAAASRLVAADEASSAVTLPISSVSHCSTMPKPRNSRSTPSK